MLYVLLLPKETTSWGKEIYIEHSKLENFID